MTMKLIYHHAGVCVPLFTKFQLLTPFIFSRAAAHRRGGSKKKVILYIVCTVPRLAHKPLNYTRIPASSTKYINKASKPCMSHPLGLGPLRVVACPTCWGSAADTLDKCCTQQVLGGSLSFWIPRACRPVFFLALVVLPQKARPHEHFQLVLALHSQHRPCLPRCSCVCPPAGPTTLGETGAKGL